MFKFRLAPLLRHRKRQEDEKMRELAIINGELVAKQEKIEGIAKAREENARKLNSLLASSKDVNSIRLYEDFLSGCESDILQEGEKLGKIKERLDKKRAELIDYVRRRRIMEIYRDRLKENYELDMKRKEQSEMDEIAGNLFFSNSPTGMLKGENINV